MHPMVLPSSLLLLSAALLAAPAASQQTFISPVTAATQQGERSNSFPFSDPTPRRYMQIHDDLPNTPMVITKLAFRMGATSGTYTNTRAIDLEMNMGEGPPLSSASFLFANNYLTGPTRTIARRVVNFGPQGTASAFNAFNSNMDLVLDQPHVYTGTRSLVWEVLVHSNTLTGAGSWATFLDADIGSRTAGTSTATGTSCTATGQTAAMVHGASYADMAGILLVNFTVTRGPANAPAILALGTANPNTAIPGLCSNLYTNLVLMLPIGVTSATGAITINDAGASTFVLPNTIQGGAIFSQVHAPDAGQPGPFQLVNSDGRQGNVPTSNLTKVVAIGRLFTRTSGVADPQAGFTNTTSLGYGLVTEFTF